MSVNIDVILAALIVITIAVLVLWRRGGAERGWFQPLARQAGYEPLRLRPWYWTAKIILAILVPLLLAEFFPLGIMPLVIAALVAFLLPDLWLMNRRNHRRHRILQALSFFLDLLVSLLRSGLDVEEAFRRAGARGLPAGHPLAQEVKIVTDEIAAGKERADAFAGLASRTRIPDLHALAAALELGSRLGFPVAEILSTQAEIQREKRVERGRRRIDRAMIVALFPVLLCGIPIFFMVVILPVILELLKTVDLVKFLFR
ncbi:MAG: tight adherence protein [Thermoanaerobaculia bacterium]|nr:tight adherence protein [Thermoanaerobaculia bacterium]